jgi:arabinogalactan endo-1,4-beta-galactosidase
VRRFTAVKSTIDALGKTFLKSYHCKKLYHPFVSWNDWTNNIMGLESQLISGFCHSRRSKKFCFELKFVKSSTYEQGFTWEGEANGFLSK